MADNIEADTDGMRKAAQDLDKVSQHLQRVLNTVEQANQAHWGSWGNDSYGTSFAGGNGYVASYRNMKANLSSKVQLVDQYSSALKKAAANLEAMNSNNADSFGGS